MSLRLTEAEWRRRNVVRLVAMTMVLLLAHCAAQFLPRWWEERWRGPDDQLAEVYR